VLQLSGQCETNNAVSNSLNAMFKYGLPDDYFQKYDENVRNLSLNQVKEVSKKLIHPNELNWFIMGDKAVILDKLKTIGFDEIIEIDADGNPLKSSGEINIQDK